MRINHDNLKQLLEAFENAPGPITTIRELKASGLNYESDEFVFHMGILNDQGFLERDDRRPGFGLTRGGNGHLMWAEVPLRLTAHGHQFAEALRSKEVWATIKRDFKEAGISTMWTVSKKLLEKYTDKKLEELLG